ncbi:MAG: Hpt domain-containing protein [Myxococcota bacterium]
MGLFSTVAALFSKKPAQEGVPTQPAAAPTLAEVPTPRAWIDEPGLLEMVGGDTGLLGEMGKLFVTENGRRLDELKAALVEGDALAVREAAHGIKSGLTNFCAPDAVALAQKVEYAGRNNALAGIAGDVDALVECIAQMTQQLQHMNGEHTP